MIVTLKIIIFGLLIWINTFLTTSSYQIPSRTTSNYRISKFIDLHNNHLIPFENDRKSLFSTKLETEDLIANDLVYANEVKRTLWWVAAAAGFSTIIGTWKGWSSAVEFISGYVLELSLSVDNLFVFLILFDYFNVEKKSQERILSYGIWGAIILRGIFIGLGSVALQKFHSILLIFAGILYFSSYKIIFSNDEEEDEDLSNNAVISFAKRYLRTTDKSDGDRFFIKENEISYATPLMLCLICVELSDVIFAFDSIPAVFGVTQDPLIVFTSNIFAIAGLRSLFGILSRAVEDLKYLEKAVGIVLGIIATKITSESFGIEILNPLQSLIVVLTVLGLGIGASLVNKNNY